MDRLYARPAAPVVITEGEKAADAAARLLPDFVTTTSPNGSNNAHKADFSHLKNRQVTIWPDADKPGQGYAQDVAGILKALGVTARIAPPLEDVEKGFDAADALAAGWTSQQARAYIESAVEAVISDRPTPKAPPKAGQALQDSGALTGMIQREAAWQLEAGHLPEAVDYAEKVLILSLIHISEPTRPY